MPTEAPTEPMPIIPDRLAAGAPYPTDPNLLVIDIHNRVSSQILADAERRGQPDLVGLTGKKDGQFFTVTATDELYRNLPQFHRVEKIVKHYPDVPAGENVRHMRRVRETHVEPVVIRKRGPSRLYRDDWGGAFGRPPKHQLHAVTHTPAYTVDFYDIDGNLTDIKRYTKDEFMAYLDGEGKEPTPGAPLTTHLYWRDDVIREISPGTSLERTLVPLTGRREILDEAMDHQDELGMPDMKGLTWTRAGHTMQITRDTMVKTLVPKGPPRPLRTWVIKVTDPEGRVAEKRRVLKDGELRDYFAFVGKQIHAGKESFADLNMHWETPKALEAPKVTSTELVQVTNPDTTKAHKLGRLSTSFVAGLDTEGPDSFEDEIPEVAGQDSPYAETLKQMIQELGSKKIHDVAVGLHSIYQERTALHGLAAPDEINNVAWFVWALAQQRAQAQQRQREKAYAGDKTPEYDAFADNPDMARRKQREIVEQTIGLTFVNTAILRDLDASPQKRVVENKELGMPEVKMLAYPVIIYKIKQEVMEGLHSFVRPEIIRFIELAKANEGQLDVESYTRLGRLVERQRMPLPDYSSLA